MGVLVSLRTIPASEPVHGRRAGPGAAEHIVAGRVQQLAGGGLVQVQSHIVDDGSGFTVHLVPADAARHRRIEAGSGWIVIGSLNRLLAGKVPGFVSAYVRFVKHLIQGA